MKRFDVGDEVQIDIPDETDPDHEPLHGVHGTIVEVLQDDAGAMAGDEREGDLFRVELESGEEVDLRWRDLRPA